MGLGEAQKSCPTSPPNPLSSEEERGNYFNCVAPGPGVRSENTCPPIPSSYIVYPYPLPICFPLIKRRQSQPLKGSMA